MAQTVGGLSSSLAGGSSSIRGYGGLASGLDRDSLIENMLAGTTGKITQQQQAKQKLAWKQEAMRGITSKLYEFSQKFMSYTSSSNLLSSKLFSANLVTALGANSDAVKVSGSSSMVNGMSITAIKQLARNAEYNSTRVASTETLEGGYMSNNLKEERADFSNVAGTSMTIKYGTKYYSVRLPENGGDGYDYNTEAGVKESLNKALSAVSVGNGKTLADVVHVDLETSTDPAAPGSKFVLKNIDNAGNDVMLAGGTQDLLRGLGFLAQGEEFENLGKDRLEITADGLVAEENAKITTNRSYAEQIGSKTISFSYNGKSADIKLLSADEIRAAGDGGMEAVQKDLQKKLDDAFGKGRISVRLDSQQAVDADGNPAVNDDGTPKMESRLSFVTTKPDVTPDDPTDNQIDNSSVLTIMGAERGLLGEYGGLTGLSTGDSNRLNMESSFLEAGVNASAAHQNLFDGVGDDEELALKINGVDIKGITKKSSISDIVDAINKTTDAGVKVSYLSGADRFTITSTQDGASGEVKLEGDVAKYLFGEEGTDYDVTAGQDAIVMVKYAGSANEVEVTRGNNTFDLNGLSVTAKKVFGYKDEEVLNDPANPAAGTHIETVRDPDAEEITFDADIDADKTAEVVKEMVEAYNEIVKLINDEVSTKPNRKYDPLTAEQEDGLSETEVEAWNEKAKAGMLFNDTDVRGLADSLRSILSGSAATLSKMGITVSTNYSENGKLVFDEEAFKSALREDPEAVKNAFTRQAEKDENDRTTDAGGLMVRMQTTMNKYASMSGSTKGILVERAGSVFAPTTILSNSLQKQMDAIDDRIEDLYDKLEVEQDRYISQFTRLETLISQMNSQSSWLSGAMGG